jgi:predicted site-specific integrase-resolvase
VTIQDQPQVQHCVSPKEFCERNHTSLTTFYELLKTGRLRAFKQGRLTFVTTEEEARYRASLPAYVPHGRS